MNSPILKDWREEIFNNLRDEVSEIFDKTGNFEDSVMMVASVHLKKDDIGNYRPFFSTIRSYFKEDAEEILRQNHYDG